MLSMINVNLWFPTPFSVQHVTRKQNDKLELLSTRYVPKSFEGEETAETLLPGYCVWIEAKPQRDMQKEK